MAHIDMDNCFQRMRFLIRGFLEPLGGKSPAIAWILSEQNEERKANN